MFRVELLGDGERVAFDCAPDSTVEAAARRAGIRLRAACYRGGCGACRALLIEGEIAYLGPVSAARTGETQGVRQVLLCRAAPASDVVLRPLSGWQTFNTRSFSAQGEP